MRTAKAAIRETLLLPNLFDPSIFQGIRRLPSTLLLAGPPGTGKTMLVQAAANETGRRLFSASPSSIVSKWAGDSEKALKRVFETAASAGLDGHDSAAASHPGASGAGETGGGGRLKAHSSGHGHAASKRARCSSSSSKENAEMHRQAPVDEDSGDSSADSGGSDHDDQDSDVDGRGDLAGRSTTNRGSGRRRRDRSPCTSSDSNSSKERILKGNGIVFLDEIDALAPSRGGNGGGGSSGGAGAGTAGASDDLGARRLLNELLILLSNAPRLYPNILVIASTNRAEDCDPALLRRFERRIYCGLPTSRDRCQLVQRYLAETHHTLTYADLMQIAEATEGWNGADIRSLCAEAAISPVREAIAVVAAARRAQGQGQPGAGGGGGFWDWDDEDDDDLGGEQSIASRPGMLAQPQQLADQHHGKPMVDGRAPLSSLLAPARLQAGASTSTAKGCGATANQYSIAVAADDDDETESFLSEDSPGRPDVAVVNTELTSLPPEDATRSDAGAAIGSSSGSGASAPSKAGSVLLTVRPITLLDFDRALRVIRPTSEYASGQYHQQHQSQQQQVNNDAADNINDDVDDDGAGYNGMMAMQGAATGMGQAWPGAGADQLLNSDVHLQQHQQQQMDSASEISDVASHGSSGGVGEAGAATSESSFETTASDPGTGTVATSVASASSNGHVNQQHHLLQTATQQLQATQQYPSSAGSPSATGMMLMPSMVPMPALPPGYAYVPVPLMIKSNNQLMRSMYGLGMAAAGAAGSIVGGGIDVQSPFENGGMPYSTVGANDGITEYENPQHHLADQLLAVNGQMQLNEGAEDENLQNLSGQIPDNFGDVAARFAAEAESSE